VGSGVEALMSQAFTTGFIIKDGQRVIDSSVGALTVQGDVNIGANSLKTTNLSLLETGGEFFFRDSLNTSYKSINFDNSNIYGLLNFIGAASSIYSPNVDDKFISINSRNNGAGLVEVARFQGAAAPALCVGNSGATANDDFAAIADQVKLGNYDIAAGRRTLALATEEAVVTEAAGASDRTLAVRINGATYRILLKV
jgi:hypothetical protein